MVFVQWRNIFNLRGLVDNTKSAITWRVSQIVLTFHTLTINVLMGQGYMVDCFLEPILWFVDNFAGCLGKVFVFCVIVLTSAVVGTAYWVGLPYWWERSPYMATFLVTFGNWLLINIVFHYYMGITTSPGHPPIGALVEEAASICKKCITPKPPRTHHCSICDRCVLKMDHHCPWLNNCIGYYNARYFFLYMVYMVIGVSFLIIAGVDLGHKVLWVNDTGGLTNGYESDLIGHPVFLNQSGVYVPGQEMPDYDEDNHPRAHNLPVIIITEAQRITADPLKRKAVVFMVIMCLSVFISLGTLTLIHAKNITRGETSIESYINATLKKTHSRHQFRNPYNFGRIKNWKLFLGLTQGRTFLRNILFPSCHKPSGTGLTWHTANREHEDWP